MGQDKILKLFFDYPANEFQIRGAAKLLKMPKSSVNYRMTRLLKQGIIQKINKGVFPSYTANAADEKYLFCKLHDAIEGIIDSGLLEYLEKETSPRCIILFGSFAKAEYDADSDIDIFIQAGEKSLSLAKYEKKLKHTINVIFGPELNKISSELFNNIINGIKLRGYIKIR